MKQLKYIIICGLLIVFPIRNQAEILDYIVAIVNDDVIVNSDLQQEMSIMLEEWKKNKRPLPTGDIFEQRALDHLIVTSLLLQLAENIGIQIEDIQLNEQLRQLAAQKKMDFKEFRIFLEKNGESYVYQREKIRQRMIIKRLQKRKIHVTLTESEIDNFMANQVQQGTENQEYHLWHILIATPDAPSPEEIKATLKKTKRVLLKLKKGADFQNTAVAVSDNPNILKTRGDLGWIKAGEMPTLFNGIVHKMAVGDIYDPLRDTSGFHIIKLVDKRGTEQNIITQTNARHILIRTNELISDFDAQNRLEKLKSSIEQGHDFVELARVYSQDTVSANDGGSIGWVNPGTLVSEFEKVMNTLSFKQVSKPFKSRYGWHIVQVLDRRKYDNTIETLRSKAAKAIQQRKLEAKFQTWLRQLRDEAYIEYRNKK